MDTQKLIKRIDERNKDLNKVGMKYWTHPDSIDENLYKEDIEIIRLDYDRAGKMMNMWGASFIGCTALTISFLWKSSLGVVFFGITALISLPRSAYRNFKMNKCFNTLRKKLKKQNK